MAIAGYLLGARLRNDDGSVHWIASQIARPLEIFGHEHAFRLITYRSKTPSQHVFDAFLTYLSEVLPSRSGGGAADCRHACSPQSSPTPLSWSE